MGPGPEKIADLEKRMKALGISKADIEEKFIKSGGRGGQKVNKSNSGVYIRHKPSNLSVKCQKSRSQHLNRFLALRRLVEKIEAQMDNKTPCKTDAQKRIDRIRKQKKRRKRKIRQKESMDAKTRPIDRA